MAFHLFGARRLLGTTGALVMLDLLALAAPAAAQDRLTVDASASMSVATNPFQQTGSTPLALSPTLQLHPTWTSERPLTTLRVEGDVQATFYNRGYGTNGSASLQGAGTHKLSEYTTLNASLGYLNTIVGTFTGGQVPVGPLVPIGADLPVFVNDPALGAIGRRRQSYQGAADIVSMLSPRDQIDVGVAVSANRFGGLAFSDFNYVAPSASYSRTLSEKFTVGADLTVGVTDYLGSAAGDATIFQPSLIATRVLNERWTLKGTLGAAIVDLTEAPGRKRTSTTFNGTANLCRRDTRWTACLDLARQTVPSAFQGVRTTTSGAATLGYRRNATDDLSVVAGYSHAGDPIQTIVPGQQFDGSLDFANANVIYSHRFRPMLSGFVNLGYAKTFGDDLKRDANLTASAGVTYRFNGR
jgi:hypothetical protein